MSGRGGREGGTYLGGWAYERGEFRLWLEEDRTLEVRGPDFEEAADELAGLVGERRGDGEAVLEFPMGRPGGAGPGVLARARNLGYNESVKALNRSPAQFEGGICPHCGFGIGARTGIPLEVDTLPKGDVAGVSGTLPWALLLSERFLALLSDDERSRIRTLPIESKAPGTFFEVVGDAVAGAVGVAGAEYTEVFHQSWRCRDCSRRMMTIEHGAYPRSSAFLSAGDIPLPIPPVFVFDEGHRLGIAVSADRWGQLAGSGGTRGISTSDVLVITESVVDPEPDLPVPEGFDWVL